LKQAKWALLAALAVANGGAARAQIAVLQIRIVEGEGAVHAAGARAPRFLTVEVTEETGKPVDGAAVTFHLPEDGPSGTFFNGLRTDVTTSDSRGRATLPGFAANREPGRFQVRIVVSKEQARAGIVSFQYLTGPAGGAVPAVSASASHHHARWLAIAALAAGGAAAGVLAGRSGAAGSPAAPPPPTAPGAPPVSIGAPTVTVGRP
jgi:hypothetical protein